MVEGDEWTEYIPLAAGLGKAVLHTGVPLAGATCGLESSGLKIFSYIFLKLSDNSSGEGFLDGGSDRILSALAGLFLRMKGLNSGFFYSK